MPCPFLGIFYSNTVADLERFLLMPFVLEFLTAAWSSGFASSSIAISLGAER
jgi:hypothetical protein